MGRVYAGAHRAPRRAERPRPPVSSGCSGQLTAEGPGHGSAGPRPGTGATACTQRPGLEALGATRADARLRTGRKPAVLRPRRGPRLSFRPLRAAVRPAPPRTSPPAVTLGPVPGRPAADGQWGGASALPVPQHLLPPGVLPGGLSLPAPTPSPCEKPVFLLRGTAPRVPPSPDPGARVRTAGPLEAVAGRPLCPWGEQRCGQGCEASRARAGTSAGRPRRGSPPLGAHGQTSVTGWPGGDVLDIWGGLGELHGAAGSPGPHGVSGVTHVRLHTLT